MKVKRYVVNSMPEAMQQIRHEMGKDAMIINSKPIKTGGLLGFFGKEKIEVIAACDEPVPVAGRSAVHLPPAVKSPQAPSRLPAVTDGKHSTYSSMTPALAPAPVPAAPGSESGAESELLRELREVKQSLYQYVIQQDEAIPPALRSITSHLLAQEMEQSLVMHFMKLALNAPEYREEMEGEAVRELYRKHLINWLGEYIEIPQESPEVIHFLGPTGVGKTTTIAKIAAKLALHDGRKVGFLTADTYRIAAVDQLKTYAGILNAAMEVVFSPRELNEAFGKLSSCDVILMDTAGRNYLNRMFISELRPWLSHGRTHHSYLVLSAATKYRDLAAIAGVFRSIGVDRAIFTKVDETQAFGSLFNLLRQHALSVAYFTTGQNVPDDILPASAEKMVSWLLDGGHRG